MRTQFTRRTLLTAAPVLALASMIEPPALPASVTPQLAVTENSLLEFFQTLRQMDKAGRASMVEWLRAQDHKIFNALADPVERYCAHLNAADQVRG
ncbi:hypothetical protein [Cypionkella sp. TWP1-2-1b2]|uniref:hypothetical protein n=1 Tax=Cypionkella sp. TWP1-2-1b2 TaxID=2804675 RepID=UPI003CF7BFE8